MSTASSQLPNLVIAGVVKGGTTSVFSYLSRHPDICSSAVKETCYFLTYRYGQYDVRYKNSSDPFSQYRDYFCHCQDQRYVMEATPGYFEGGRTLANEMKNVLGDDTKILIILRDPVARLLSFFKYKKSMLQLDQDLSLSDYISKCEQMPLDDRIKEENDAFWGIDGGFYSNYLEEWFDVFGHSVKVMFFDQLKADSRLMLREISDWLSIDATIYDTEDLEVENKTVNYKFKRFQEIALQINNKAEKFWRSHPNIKSKLRDLYYSVNASKQTEEFEGQTLEYLQAIYQPYNVKLAAQLRSKGYSDLPSWLTSIS